MSSRNRKPKRAKRLPAIVPRFLKGVVTIGAIPTLAVACEKGRTHVQPPVVAQYSAPVVAEYVAPVVAAYAADAETPTLPADAGPATQPPPVVAAYVPHEAPRPPADAGVDAPRAPKKPKSAKVATPPPPPPPVVAALIAPPPPVVAAYVPRNDPAGKNSPSPKPKK